jgi:hypothetical protein
MAGEVGEIEIVEIHCQKTDVRSDIAEPESIVKLDAIKYMDVLSGYHDVS